MIELHAWALAPAAVGTCCMAVDRRRARVPELAASVLMLVAMADAASLHAVAPVVWCAILLAAAMGLAAIRGRRRTLRGDGTATLMQVHGTMGLVVMAGLTVLMGVPLGPVPDGAHHGGGGSLVPLGVAVAVAYAAASVALALRAGRHARDPAVHARGPAVHAGRLGRVQLVAMGASVAAMGLALLG